MEKPVVFTNDKKQQLVGMIHIPKVKGRRKFPAVIICSGFDQTKSGKYRIFTRIARNLCSKEFIVLRFDFSGQGDSEGNFADITITQQLNDLDSAIEFMKKQKQVDNETIGLLGHSRGGEIVLLRASKDKSLKASVVLAPVVDYRKVLLDEYSKKAIKNWRTKGYIDMRADRLKKNYLEDMLQYKVIRVSQRINSPTLIIHGRMDELIDVTSSRDLYKRLKCPRNFHIVNGADHNFNNKQQMQEVINESAKWFKKWLR